MGEFYCIIIDIRHKTQDIRIGKGEFYCIIIDIRHKTQDIRIGKGEIYFRTIKITSVKNCANSGTFNLSNV